MSIEFENAILAGMTLIREAIQSQNYAPNTAGWQIASDGRAEFSDMKIRSSDGSGATVEIENGRAIFTAPSGWQIIVDPTNPDEPSNFPVIYFVDAEGDEAGAINATGDNARAGLMLSSGPFADGGVPDWRWATFMGQHGNGDNLWMARRVRSSDPNRFSGGYSTLGGAFAQIGVRDSAAPADSTYLHVEKDLVTLSGGRILISPRPSSSAALRVAVASPGHTGRLLLLEREGSAKLTVDAAGSLASAANLTAAEKVAGKELQIADTTFPSYTPVMTGHGSAVYTSTGWYYEFGDLIYVHAFIQCSAAGSGATGITVSLPFTPYRSGQRQYLPAYAGGIAAGSNAALGGVALGNINFSGAGAIIDQIRSSTDIQYRGYNLSDTSTFTIDGWFRRI